MKSEPKYPLKSFERAGLTFDVADAGSQDGDTVILLHGFPEDFTVWTHLTSLLSNAGYRVIAPNQRGRSSRARPKQRRAYALSEYVFDVLALMEAAGLPRAHLVGHDLGGSVAWAMAENTPNRLASLTVISTPHPRALLRSLVTSNQLLKSWYLLLFQLPFFPEAIVRLRGGRVAAKWLERLGLPTALALEYVSKLAQPGEAKGAFNWYRGLLFEPFHGFRAKSWTVPTLYVWGDRDAVVTRAAAESTCSRAISRCQQHVVIGGSHWLPEMAAAELAKSIVSHLRSNPVG